MKFLASWAVVLLTMCNVSLVFAGQHAEQNNRPNYERHWSTESEPVCRANLMTSLFSQQVTYSDRESSPEIKKRAEESIDAARLAYEESGSYCNAGLALRRFLEAPTHADLSATPSEQTQ
ncbi:hypothetical protein [Enterovibrio baiacu]|uniref:hypothetical protein n=1 Tax=Enterovibrio baiacu TaxID=2491023 RepID=UPI001011F585|nr:hypothetical protein [Enterovibrio baiacu]MBE1275380.1 hypothetical protein [Enterovibrio baiacu]